MLKMLLVFKLLFCSFFFVLISFFLQNMQDTDLKKLKSLSKLDQRITIFKQIVFVAVIALTFF